MGKKIIVQSVQSVDVKLLITTLLGSISVTSITPSDVPLRILELLVQQLLCEFMVSLSKRLRKNNGKCFNKAILLYCMQTGGWKGLVKDLRYS